MIAWTWTIVPYDDVKDRLPLDTVGFAYESDRIFYTRLSKDLDVLRWLPLGGQSLSEHYGSADSNTYEHPSGAEPGGSRFWKPAYKAGDFGRYKTGDVLTNWIDPVKDVVNDPLFEGTSARGVRIPTMPMVSGAASFSMPFDSWRPLAFAVFPYSSSAHYYVAFLFWDPDYGFCAFIVNAHSMSHAIHRAFFDPTDINNLGLNQAAWFAYGGATDRIGDLCDAPHHHGVGVDGSRLRLLWNLHSLVIRTQLITPRLAALEQRVAMIDPSVMSEVDAIRGELTDFRADTGAKIGDLTRQSIELYDLIQNGSISADNGTLSEITSALDQIVKDIEKMDDKYDLQAAEVAKLSQDLSKAQGEINSLNAFVASSLWSETFAGTIRRVGIIEDAVEDLQESLGDVATEVSAATDAVASLTTALSDLTDTLLDGDTVVSAAALAALDARVKSVENSLKTLDTTVTTKNQAYDAELLALSSAVSVTKTDLTALKSRVESLERAVFGALIVPDGQSFTAVGRTAAQPRTSVTDWGKFQIGPDSGGKIMTTVSIQECVVIHDSAYVGYNTVRLSPASVEVLRADSTTRKQRSVDDGGYTVTCTINPFDLANQIAEARSAVSDVCDHLGSAQPFHMYYVRDPDVFPWTSTYFHRIEPGLSPPPLPVRA